MCEKLDWKDKSETGQNYITVSVENNVKLILFISKHCVSPDLPLSAGGCNNSLNSPVSMLFMLPFIYNKPVFYLLLL